MRLIAPLLLLLLVCSGTASATDYYVSTTGDNSSAGTSLGTAWASIQYGVEHISAGDTLYIVNGTYYENYIGSLPAYVSMEYIDYNANATHQVTIKAYNGTPTIQQWHTGVTNGVRGLYLQDDDYINIDGLRFSGINISNILTRGILSQVSRHINITNCSTEYTGVGIYLYQKCNHTTIKNCTVVNGTWNMVMISNNALDMGTMHNISIIDCTIRNSTGHGGIDMVDNLTDVRMTGNIIEETNSAVFTHGNDYLDYHFDNCVFNNNTIINCRYQGVHIIKTYDWDVSNNVFTDTPGTIDISGYNTTVYNNTVNNGVKIYLTGDNHTLKSNMGCFRSINAGNVTITDLRDKSVSMDCGYRPSNTEVLLSDGKVMTYAKYWDYNTSWFLNPVRYYPDKTNFSYGVEGSDLAGVGQTVTTYNITLRPTNAYLKDVTVSHVSDAADDRTNIVVNSSVASNPTWINATMQNLSNTYNVSIDGGYVTQVVSDANKIVRYNYTASWSSHTFEFDWASSAGFTGAPDPTNIANTTGETWVRHSWSAGSGNVTDSYNVSANSVWHNTTTNAYYNNTGLSAEDWSNITIWAYNNTGGISQNSISQNTQSDAAAWTPSNTAMYYNTTSPITITTKTDGTNLFSRTPTEADSNATSGRMVIKT